MPESTSRYCTALALLVLCVTAWMAHFHLSGQFLLYEDDYVVIGRTLDMGPDDLAASLRSIWRNLPQGRPLHFTFGRLFTFLGFRLGGLQGLYAVAFAIVALNTMLFYMLLRNISPASAAFFGALAFCLFPADTGKPFLTHAFMVQPGLTFLLGAFLLYLGRRPYLAYVVIGGSVLTYEPTALPFLCAPLLKAPWDKRRGLVLLAHIGGIFCVMAGLGLCRWVLHEHRMVEFVQDNFLEFSLRILGSLVLGPLTVVWTFISHFIKGAVNAQPWGLTAGVIFFAMVWPLVQALHIKGLQDIRKKPPVTRIAFKTRVGTFKTEARFDWHIRGAMRLLITGFSMRSAAYILSFTYWPPLTTAGAETRLHLAATVGGSMVFAGITWVFMYVGKAYKERWTSTVALTMYLGFLLCFHTTVQDDFVKSAGLQKDFWRQAAALCPDMEGGSVIWVEPEGLEETDFISTRFWSDRLVLDLLFDFPHEWKAPPRLYVLKYHLKESVRLNNKDELVWNRPVQPPQNLVVTPLPQENVILLAMKNGRLERRFGTISFGPDAILRLKPMGKDVLGKLPPKALHPFMMNGRGGA